MKSVLVIVGLFAMLAIHVTSAGLDVCNIVTMANKCKNQTGATDEDLKSVKPNTVPQTHVLQCYSGCLNHELGFVYPNNTINVENIKALYTGLKQKNPDLYQKSIKVAEICAAKVTANSDDCLAGKVAKQCFLEEQAKIGL